MTLAVATARLCDRAFFSGRGDHTQTAGDGRGPKCALIGLEALTYSV